MAETTDAADELEALVRQEWPEGRSAGAAARELCRWLGAHGKAPTLVKMLQEMSANLNRANSDRAQILKDFEDAAPEAANEARYASFLRWNPHIKAESAAA